MKPKGASILKKAERAYKNREFAETIRLLEPQVFIYRQNPKFYYLLGMACIRTGDFAGAYSYLKRAEQLDPQNLEVKVAVAVIHLKRYETEQSIRYWLEVLDEDPHNSFARKGLELLKKRADPEGIEELFDSGKVFRILPSPGFYLPKTGKWVLGILVLLIAGGLAYRYGATHFKREAPRPEILSIQLDKGTTLVDPASRSRYMLTQKEISESFQRIKELLQEYRDTEARIEMNRLLLSNATRDVKEKVRALLPYLREPTFLTLKTSVSYQEVMKDPALYEGCYVRWKGRVTNLRISEKEITFDLLVGYQDQRILEGIVPVTLRFSAKVDPSFAYEVLGEILLKGNSIQLRGVSLHELGI
ncbi:MAG: tetratricopeptide repeat protein [Spirochaetes bacterium]|nr:tetratricopeptide repeat protein [Spirochaetota bacterium]